MLFLSALPFQILLGTVSAYIAYKKNRSYIAWFFGGFLLGLIGVITILILPPIEITSNSNQESQKKNENVADNPQKSRTASIEDCIQPSEDPTLLTVDQTSGWYYLNENRENIGPMGLKELIEAITKAPRKKETWIWKKGMPDWKRARDIPSINEQVN